MSSASAEPRKSTKAPGWEWQNDWATVSTGLPPKTAALLEVAVFISGVNRSKLIRVLLESWLRGVFGKEPDAVKVKSEYIKADPITQARAARGVKGFIFNPERSGDVGGLLGAAKVVLESPAKMDCLREAVDRIEGRL